VYTSLTIIANVLASRNEVNSDLTTASHAVQTLGQLLSKKESNSGVPINRREATDRQIQLYLAEKTLSTEADPLQWWNMSGTHFNILSVMAKKYLSLCATSVTSERLFSVAGNIVTSRRTRLRPDNVNELVFLSCNLSKQVVMADTDDDD
jgi:hypothetical protein